MSVEVYRGATLDWQGTLDQYDDDGNRVGPLDLTGCTLTTEGESLKRVPAAAIQNPADGEIRITMSPANTGLLEKGSFGSFKLILTQANGSKMVFPPIRLDVK